VRLQEIIAAVQDYHPSPDLEIIRQAFSFVREQHKGQTRASGEPYVTHVTEVAYLATQLKLDIPSVVTALLHDTVEDTTVTLRDIETRFGSDIAQLVDGVTKLSQVNFSSKAEQQAENFRKMLLAMARDIRVLLVKLCDRLHNMRTLGFLSESRQLRIARETMDIYAPLAHRLGINWMKSELEDLSFRYLKPELYENIKSNVAKKKKERERYIQEVGELISTELEQNGVKGTVAGRPKHFFSIYQKMDRGGLEFDEIHDLIAFRILVSSTIDCYAVLGVIHAAWKPIPGRFKDYIAMPKANNYQSLHTTVIGPQGTRIEIQIRTEDMHEVAEGGIAAHWVYKKEGKSIKLSSKDGMQFSWLKDLVESEKMLRDPIEFMSIVKDDLFPHQVFVFSPKGDVIALQSESTPIDFAYHIHSEVGQHCTGARVNGQQVSLGTKLRNGDTIEIVTSTRQVPNKDWLNMVVTSKAKQRIRTWLKQEERDRSITIGKELLSRDLPKVKLSLSKVLKDGSLKRLAEELSQADVDSLFAEIGYGKLEPSLVLKKLAPEAVDIESRLAEEESALQKIFNNAARSKKERSGVTVSGLNDVVFRFAQCCEPLPGEPLVGFVTRGRGVVVHTRGCPHTMSFDPQRLIEVSWDSTAPTQRRVKVTIYTKDKVGVLAAITQTISAAGANIATAQVQTSPDGKASNTLEMTVTSSAQLENIIRQLEGIDGVLRVERRKRAK